jgi:methylthioribose-1-phosphate isomerase
MDFKDTSARSVWVLDKTRPGIGILDQRHLPHRLVVEELYTQQEVFEAIRAMHTRGAPLIGAVAAFGVWLAAANDRPEPDYLLEVCRYLDSARPTAVNLAWALERQRRVLEAHRQRPAELLEALLREARAVAEEDVTSNAAIGQHGLELIRACYRARPEGPVRVLTHCNAGWLATVAWGTATAPIYMAHEEGIPLQVWVDETRPRNQGAQLTAWELGQRGVPHTLISDNAGGHLMQRGEVDLVLVGTDRTTRSGDVANKIGTYLKALAARDNGVPFYVALPSSTIDWSIRDGMTIPIEERSAAEVQYVEGLNRQGEPDAVRICPASTPAANPAFDVTPARLISGLITERGICEASEAGLLHLFPERRLAETVI